MHKIKSTKATYNFPQEVYCCSKHILQATKPINRFVRAKSLNKYGSEFAGSFSSLL